MTIPSQALKPRAATNLFLGSLAFIGVIALLGWHYHNHHCKEEYNQDAAKV